MAVEPDWSVIRDGLVAVEAHVARLGVPALARADQLRAFARDFFDAVGLDVTDEETVYVALVTASLMVEFADRAHRRGQAAPAHLHGVSAMARTLAAILAPYVPPEARR